MKFTNRNLRELAHMVIGDTEYFRYRSSKFITEFFQDCGIDVTHDGSTRWAWAMDRLSELLAEPQSSEFTLPSRFMSLLRSLMDLVDADVGDPGRLLALEALNKTLRREGFEAFYADDEVLHVRHLGTKKISSISNPHRPLTAAEIKRREEVASFLDSCSEDELIEQIMVPLFRHLGYHRISVAGHKDKALEYGKDVWMRYTLPTQHVIYFGIQAKKGKLDASGASKGSNSNIAEVYNQVLMMLGHEIFDPEVSRKVLVDHAFIVAGGEITKQARNWLGSKLDVTKRSQIMFMDRNDIFDLYIVSNVPLPDQLRRNDITAGLTAQIPF
jgi:hypothetical protein